MKLDTQTARRLWGELRDSSPIDQNMIGGAGLVAFDELRKGKSIGVLAEELDSTGYFEPLGWDLKAIRTSIENLVLRASFCSRTYTDSLRIAFENRLSFSLKEKGLAPGVPRDTHLSLRRFSPVRDLEGGFVDLEHFSYQLRSKHSLIDVYAARILRQTDAEDLHWFFRIPAVVKRLEGVERRKWLGEISRVNEGTHLSSSMAEALNAWLKEGVFSYSRYYRDLLDSVDSTSALNKIGVVYIPEHTAKIGTELLIELLKSHRQDQRYLPLTYQLIRDGADWYQAFMISAHGRGVVHDLATTNLNPVEQFEAVMELKGLTPGKREALVQGVAEHLVIEYAKTRNKADDLYRLAGRRCLLPLVSNKIRDEVLARDLGL
ncbi:hypothetical protein [Pseudomonas amygdali]|uniref:Uncharacterized protein n=2 Tax=Pseudomonas amygdali pv. lachrymans TaxID=53707 RepID=A0ABR5KTB2_PSEAV|nr:hypothetical protein [Pseudomonas amygdali]AXH60360.1 hypothetical protein PLA107_034890 [Pseudomonas amygdali pv. lachrymans str. M301315]KPC17746.1 Uncharacterized protein AC499_0948 [Pseudomonas amygdali pv. lachrymans]RMT08684.1 hypothetical protein ALP54_102749 [Pseudomonas amygdali pv. lachrymans]